MAPSLFSSRPLADDLRPSPPSKSRLKSFSAFLSNPFTSANANANANTSAPHHASPGRSKLVSAPIPYQPPKSDISMTNLSLTNSPFRVYIKDDGLPTCSPGSSGRGPPARSFDFVTGLPASHYPLAGLSVGVVSGEKPIWKEMPTLASAISIAEGFPPTSTTFGPTSPLPTTITSAIEPPLPEPESQLPPSTSSTSSVFDMYRNRRVRRSTSRSSSKNDVPSAPGRRMSRRLSFDNILHSFGPARRKDRHQSEDPAMESDARRWSTMDTGNSSALASGSKLTSTAAPANAVKPNRLALPPMRSLRNKFSVGAKSGNTLLAAAKADVAARKRIHEYDNTGSVRRVRKEEGGEMSSVGSAMGAGVLKRMAREGSTLVTNHPLAQADSADDLPLASLVQAERTSISREPVETVGKPVNLHRASVVPQAASPAAERIRAAQSPAHDLRNLFPPAVSREDLSLSPAQDDKSIVDPSRSPLPFGLSVENLGSPFPPFSDPPAREGSALPSDEEGEGGVGVAKRQKSLSEIKDAFSRMRDISRLDISSQTGSLPPSRRVSEALEEPTNVAAKTTLKSRQSLDLVTLDESLRTAIEQNTQDTGRHHREPSRVTLRPNLTESQNDLNETSASNSSSDEMTAHTTVTQQDEDEAMTRAQSGRSWHTAQEDAFPHSPPRGLPRSKSKSTHGLASLASGKDLVEQIERNQGEGWWSVDRRTIGRRASNIDTLRRNFDRGDEDKRIKLLEKLATTSAIPFRSRLPRPPTPDSPDSPDFTPSKRPQSALDGRKEYPRTTVIYRAKHTAVEDWRPATVQPRQRGVYNGPRPSLVAGSTWGGDSRSSLGADDTPTRPSTRRGPFATSKISPDIARRASCLTRRMDEDPTSRQKDTVSVLLEKIEQIKTKHAVELDAIIDSLTAAKSDNKTLREENEGLRKTLGVRTVEKEVLAERVSTLEARVRDLTADRALDRVSMGHSTRGRSISITSTLLPELTVPNETLVLNVSPLEGPFSPDDGDLGEVDEFGRTNRSRKPPYGIKALRRRENRESTLYDTSTGSMVDDECDEGEGDEWTLRLRKVDEAHLDDL